MNEFFNHLNTPFGGALFALILSAAVRALPEPVPMGGLFYRWLYNFSHTLLANFDKVVKK